MKASELRAKFLTFFKERGHQHVPSSSVLPIGDPSLFFTNAGMNQFKPYFLEQEKHPFMQATSCQACIRAGGKHNDLENVGFTKRHLTFFEMLGNFSFGAYFAEDALTFAWEFLTEVLALDKEKLYVTVANKALEDVFGNPSPFSVWLKLGVPETHIYVTDENYWCMGPTGPCGPCSEIFFDLGPSFGAFDFEKRRSPSGIMECGFYV